MKNLLKGALAGLIIISNSYAQNIGIGTNAPIHKLTVQTADANFGITHTNGTIKLSTYIGNGSAYFGTSSLNPLNIMTGNYTAMTITNGGYVGIGTTTPSSILTISDPSSNYGLMHLNGTVALSTYADFYKGMIGTISTHPFSLMADGVEWVTLLPNGNVGLGSNTPAEKLEITTVTSKYGLTHTDGIVVVGSYIAPGAGWLGTKTNSPLGLIANGTLQATILTNGNLGVGTATPAEKLTVQTSGNNYGFLQSNGTVSLGTYASLTSGSIGTKTNHPLGFFTNNGVQQVTLLQNGNLGIGTTTPQVDLHVNPGGAGSILIGTSRTSGGYTCLEAGISSQSGGNGYIQATKSSGSSYGALLLNPNGGNVGINHSDNTFQYPLDINQRGLFGMILHNTTSGDAWEMYTEGQNTGGFLTFSKNGSMTAQIANNGAYIQLSDARFKKNITGMHNVLDGVLRLQPREYEYKTNNPANEKSIGFIAQEVREIFPSLTAEIKNPHKEDNDPQTYYGVNYAGFSVIAIKAIQEQQVIIKDQQKQIDELRKLVDQINAKINTN